MKKTDAPWLEERKRGIGGSDAGAVAGLSPYRTPLDVWMDKTGRADPLDDNEAMFWGRALEDVVAKVYMERTGDKVRRRGMIWSKEHPFMVANLDRVIVGDPRGVGVLEVKTAGQFTADQWGESGTDHVPEAYLAQVAHYMAVTGYAWARLAVLIGGRDFRVYDIPRDDELIAALIDIERRFWEDHVKADMPPDPANTADIAKRWPRDTGTSVQADATTLAACERLQNVKAQIKALDKERSGIEDEIKLAMADASTLLGPDGKPLATWKTQTANRLDVKSLRAALPDVAEDFSLSTESRVFRLK